jgi:outer membrane protein OmpU
MNNSTRNLKMKKLLIASTALVATAGMASADITISGHAAAGIHSGLDATAAVAGIQPTTLQSTAASTASAAGVVTAGTATAMVVGTTASNDAQKLTAVQAVEAARAAVAAATTVQALQMLKQTLQTL